MSEEGNITKPLVKGGLKKCSKCNSYTLKDSCDKCNSITSSADYRFPNIRDAPPRSAPFKRK